MVLEQVLVGLAEMCQDAVTIRAAATQNWAAIPTKAVVRLQEQFQRHRNNLFLVTARSIILPPPPVYENSSHKEQVENAIAKKRIFDLRLQRAQDDRDKYQKQLATLEKRGGGGGGFGGGNNNPNATKKGPGGGADKPLNPDKAGDLVYRVKGLIPQITYRADETKDCSAHLRQGVACKFGARCKFLHTSISGMPADKQQRYYKLVTDTENLDFDWARVPKTLFPLAYQHTNPAGAETPHIP